MSFLEFLNTDLAPRPDKATGEDFILAVRKLADVTAEQIPNCIYDYAESADARKIIADAISALESGDSDTALNELRKYATPSVRVNIERLFVLVWIMALKEQPDLILEDVAKLVDMTNEVGVQKLLRRIWNFWTNIDMAELEGDQVDLIAVDDEPEESEVNPPGSP